ncbi:EpsG family protein [Flavobacterium sp. WC2409]|uniref:EpsG family protein n=1 Tax=Flavobacterium sp. WC2409 TaxID=3234139 RepID=A0AB39W4J1_9FLAO
MGIYIFIAVFLGVLAFDRKTNLFLPFILLFIVSVFRAQTVGIDYVAYKTAYLYEISSNVPLSYLLYKFEIGWLFLNIFMQSFSGSFEFLIAIVSFFTIFSFFYVLRKETKSPIFAILLYVLLFYYSLSFSLIKQGLATSFFLLSVYFFSENKKVKSIFSALLFAVLHYSSIALIPFAILAHYIKVSNKKMLISLLVTFCIGILGITDEARSLIMLLPFEKYAHYADYKVDVDVNRLNVYLFLVPKNIMCCIIFYYLPEAKKIYKNLFFFGLIIANLFISISLVSRFVLYFFSFEIILLTNLIFLYNGKKRTNLLFAVIIYALVYFIYNLITNRGGVIPYKLYFQW